MERTGEIDFTSLTEGQPLESVGQLIIAKRDNKLYLDLLLGSTNGKLTYYKNTGSTTNPTFSLITGFLGGVDVKQYGWTTGFSMPFMYNDAGVTKLLVGSEIGNVYLYDNIDGNLTGTFNEVDTTLFHVNEGPRCAPFYEDITNDGARDLFLGNYAGGLAFFNSTNVNQVGVKELFTEENVTVFPNPASDIITIAIKDNSYDVLGKVVFEKNTFNKMIDVDVSQFSKGVYVIQLQGKDSKQFKAVTKKVVVQ